MILIRLIFEQALKHRCLLIFTRNKIINICTRGHHYTFLVFWIRVGMFVWGLNGNSVMLVILSFKLISKIDKLSNTGNMVNKVGVS